MSSYPLFHSHSLSLSHISSFTSSSPTHSPPCLFISLTSLSPMDFSPLPLHIPNFFISHGFFPHLFISPIDCTLNLLFKLSTTHYPNNWCCTRNFFLPPMLMWWLVYERCKFFLFCSLIGFVNFVVCVITKFVFFYF